MLNKHQKKKKTEIFKIKKKTLVFIVKLLEYKFNKQQHTKQNIFILKK